MLIFIRISLVGLMLSAGDLNANANANTHTHHFEEQQSALLLVFYNHLLF